MELLGDVGHVESRSVRLEMVLVLVQDRCTVCAKHTIGSDIILDATNGTPRRFGSCCDVDKDNSTSIMIQQFVTAIPAKLGHVSASLFHINRKILKSSFQRNKRCIFWTSELRVMIVLVEGAHAAQHLREN